MASVPLWLQPGSGNGEGALPKNLASLLLNCNWDEATEILNSARDRIPAAAGAHVIVQLMKYLSSFELQHKQPVLDSVRYTEKQWSRNENASTDFYSQAAVLHIDVVLADCGLCEALTHFVSMDMAGYLKGSWKLRGTWKLYERSYKKAKELHDQFLHLLERKSQKCTCLLGDVRPKSNSQFDYQTVEAELRPRANSDQKNNGGVKCLKHSHTESEIPSKEDLEKSEIAHHLLSSAAFGFGLFNLVLSILSPQALRIVQFFGFPGDRSLGIACLKFVSRSRHPLKGPFATLALLWYHTVVRPFFALDGNAIASGCNEAETLIKRQPDNEDTVLFLFFRGRCHRLKRQVAAAFNVYQEALNLAGSQRELRLMCTYEIGWCHLLSAKWDAAKIAFLELRDNSRWSPAFYCYIAALCAGLEANNAKQSKEFSEQILPLIQRKNNPVEAFVIKRAKKITNGSLEDGKYCLVHLLEIIYIWKGLEHAPDSSLFAYAGGLNGKLKVGSLGCLVKAAVSLRTGQFDRGEKLLREGIELWETVEGKDKNEKHIPAFCSYELGVLLLSEERNLVEGKKFMEQCKTKYKGYDFENRLVVRADAALANLKKQQEEKSNNNNENKS